MRRKDREITDFKKILEIMDGCDCCRIGLVDDYGPYIVPMNFGFESINEKITLYFHSANTGKKIDLIKKQKTASFQMDSNHRLVKNENPCSYSFLFESIMGYGEIQILENHTEKIHGLQRIMNHYTNKQDYDFSKKALEETTVIRLTVKAITCKAVR